jgi:hypothetical protein
LLGVFQLVECSALIFNLNTTLVQLKQRLFVVVEVYGVINLFLLELFELLLLLPNMFLLGLDKVQYFWSDPGQPIVAAVLIPSYLLENFFI